MTLLTNIKTSLANKAVVSELTQKLALGPENVIGRLAFAYSVAQPVKLNLKDIKDVGGKEYSVNVLFGQQNTSTYVALICQKYGIYKTDKDVSRYIKMHLDDGIELLKKEYLRNNDVVDFFFPRMQKGIMDIN